MYQVRSFDVHMDSLSTATSADSQTPMSIGSLTSEDQNHIKEVPQKFTVQTVLSDQQLMKLADELGEKWEPLSIHIGFKRSDIFRFKQDNSSVLMAIHAMLVEWRQRQYNQDDVQAVGEELSHALASCGRLDLSGMVDHMCSNKQIYCI